MVDKDLISRLDPRDRIKKLRELEDKGKKEIEEVQKLIRASQNELEKGEEDEKHEEDLDRRMSEKNEGLELQVGPVRREEEVDEEDMADAYRQLLSLGKGGQNDYETRQQAIELYREIMGMESDAERYMSVTGAMREISQQSKRLIKEILGDYAAKQEYRPGT